MTTNLLQSDLWRLPLAGYDPWRDSDGFVFDEKTANNIIGWIEAHCILAGGDGAGKKYRLLDWQKQFYGHLFGWRHANNRDIRRYKTAILYIPKKNGKTSMAAPIIPLTLKHGKGEQQIKAIAPSKGQASIIMDKVRGIIDGSEHIGKGVRVIPHMKSFYYMRNGIESSAKVVSNDGKLQHGQEPSLVIVDETLSFTNRSGVDALTSGMHSRENGLIIHMTTAQGNGYSPFASEVELAERIRDGKTVNPRYFPVIFAAPADADWHDEKVWMAVNPSLGTTIRLEKLREEHELACLSKEEEIKFRRYYLNQPIATSDTWLALSDWDACREMERDDLDGRECIAGIDLSSSDDISAVVLWFPREKAVICRFYCPEKTYSAKMEYRAVFSDYLRRCPGPVIDYQRIREDLHFDRKKYNITHVGFDPAFARDLSAQLEGDGFNMIKVGQGSVFLTDPTRQIERHVRNHDLCHFRDPVLRWMVGNAVLYTGHNGQVAKVTKRHKSSQGKIDGLSALITAKAVELEGAVVEEKKELVFRSF